MYVVRVALSGVTAPSSFQAGMYIFVLLDYFALNWSLLIMGFFECMALSWVYGKCSAA